MNSNLTASERKLRNVLSSYSSVQPDHNNDWQMAGQKQQIDVKFSLPESDSDMRICRAEWS